MEVFMAGAQAAWGLDVGITSLKALKLRRDGDKVAVEALQKAPWQAIR